MFVKKKVYAAENKEFNKGFRNEYKSSGLQHWSFIKNHHID